MNHYGSPRLVMKRWSRSRMEERASNTLSALDAEMPSRWPRKTTAPASSLARPPETSRTTGKTSTPFNNTIKTNNSTAGSQSNNRLRAGRAQGTSTHCSKCNAQRTSRKTRLTRSSSRAYRVNQNNRQASVSQEMAPIKSQPSKSGGGAHRKAPSSSKRASQEVVAKVAF